MALRIPASALTPSAGRFGLAQAGIAVQVIGVDAAIARMKLRVNRVVRARTVGVDRVGRHLLADKKLKCKMGLYSGQEVGPNKYRFGWAQLGPAKTVFTRAVYNSHRIGERARGMSGDSVEVVAGGVSAPHASTIHGPMEHEDIFYNKMIRRFVRTRPWMKATNEDKLMVIEEITKAYKGL